MQNPFTEYGKRVVESVYAFGRENVRNWRLYIGAAIVLVLFFLIYIFSTPGNFPTRTIVTVRSGAGLAELSQTLYKEHVIRSPIIFRMLAITEGAEHGMQAGDYYLPAHQSVFTIVNRMIHGVHDVQTVKVTIPEGFTVKEISALFDKRFPLFNHAQFEKLAQEGYLFPDTYFFGINATATSTIALLQSNFHAKVDPLTAIILVSGHTFDEVITMASILEAEVRTDADRKLVSGILWKRIDLGMPLQVDSAQSTYKTKGLPDAPIGNPGLDAIVAALYPKSSPYLYFLNGNDKDHTTHYAKTLDEHDDNIKKYIK